MGKVERYWEAKEYTRIIGKSWRRKEDIWGQMSFSGAKAQGLAEHPNQPMGKDNAKGRLHILDHGRNCGLCFPRQLPLQFLEGGYYTSLHRPFFPQKVLKFRRGRTGYSQCGCPQYNQKAGTSPGNLAGFF